MEADIAIVGAGVVGLFTALEALHRGLDVLVLEAERPGSGASSANAGVLHLLQPPPGKMRRRLAPLGARLYREWAERLGLEIYETSLIIASLSRAESLLLRPIAFASRRLVPDARVRVAGRKEIERVEPLIGPRVRGGVIVEGYGVVEPRSLIDNLARHLSGRILESKSVEAIHCRGDHVIIETGDGETLRSRAAVNAAGPGAERLARAHGVRVKVKLKPGTMELYRHPRPANILARVPRSSKTKGGAIIPWPQGTLYGPDLRESPDTPRPPAGEVAKRYEGLLAEEPRGLLEVIEGLRTVASPRDFHIIAPKSCPRTVHLLGIESPGLTAAPALARLALERLGLPQASSRSGRAVPP